MDVDKVYTDAIIRPILYYSINIDKAQTAQLYY